ncbi:unnamed protein product [Urochloa humidicola]
MLHAQVDTVLHCAGHHFHEENAYLYRSCDGVLTELAKGRGKKESIKFVFSQSHVSFLGFQSHLMAY